MDFSMDEKEVKGKKASPAKKKSKKGEAESDGAEKKSGSKKKLIIIIALVVAVAVGAGYYFFFMPKGEKPIVYAYYSPGEYFVTNVKDSSRLLKSSIVLVLNTEDSKLQENLTTENARIRDTIIFLLREQGEDELRSTGNKDDLRKNIIEQLNIQLNIDNIVDVLFNDFVMQ